MKRIIINRHFISMFKSENGYTVSHEFKNRIFPLRIFKDKQQALACYAHKVNFAKQGLVLAKN